jgi:hypothetical protein
MGSLVPRSRLRAIIIGGALVATLALPAVVSADTTGPGGSIAPAASNGATIAVDTDVTVMSKLVATVDLAFTCDPFMVYDWQTGETVPSTSGRLEFGSVSIVQASGRTILSSATEYYGGDVTCDGSTVHSRSIPVVAQTQPWKSGAAVIGATVYVVDEEYQQSRSASSGPIAVKLTK